MLEITRSSLPVDIPRDPATSPALVYLARLSPRSRSVQRHALERIVRLMSGDDSRDIVAFAWHHLRYEHTTAIRTALAEQYAPATANRMRSALRGVLREAWLLGLMSADEAERARNIPTVRGFRLPKGRAVPFPELLALFGACDADASSRGRRDAAILAVLYSGGVRRSESVSIDLADYSARNAELRIIGKGNKERLVALSASAIARIERWLDDRSRHDGPMFVRIRKGDHIGEERLTDEAVRWLLAERCAAAGIPDTSPHDFRRSMISDLLDAGVDISTVQRQAGHASVTTTQRYDRRGEDVKRSAVAKLRQF